MDKGYERTNLTIRHLADKRSEEPLCVVPSDGTALDQRDAAIMATIG